MNAFYEHHENNPSPNRRALLTGREQAIIFTISPIFLRFFCQNLAC